MAAGERRTATVCSANVPNGSRVAASCKVPGATEVVVQLLGTSRERERESEERVFRMRKSV